MDDNEYDLIICVYGCDTIPKYNEQIRIINETWGQLCNISELNVKLLYFLGEKTNDDSFIGENYIHLPGVFDDYLSASYKQYLGLKYIHENFKYKFVFCCGTDTYVNIPKMTILIKSFDYNENLYIGGDIGWRVINGVTYYFFFGGGGFILTKKCLSLLYPLIPNIMEKWSEICIHNKREFEPNEEHYNTLKEIIVSKEHIDSCDISIAYFLQQPEINSNVVNLPKLFYYCNYQGFTYDPNYPTYSNKDVIIDHLVTCHLMTTQDCYDFTKLLIENSHYMDIPLFCSGDLEEVKKNKELGIYKKFI